MKNMMRSGCLLALLLVGMAGAARAQQELEPVAPTQPPALRGQPVQSPALQPPGTAIETLVPPYPGTVPTFASASQFVDYGRWRLEQLSARERGLILLGRPDGYQGKRAGGFVMVGAGAGLALTCMAILFLNSSHLDSGDSSEGGLSDSAEAGLVGGMLIGTGLAIGGAIWLKHLKRANQYRDEIAGLRAERTQWAEDIKRARRQARVEQQLSFDLSRLRLTF